ncbi:F0F1 ATP synthase assembly protein I [Sphingobium sp. H39-3-25]|uniref:F0F1 ATP synthase assembly protein I n=1 Tax=Sphingobium arseniciresistens TaxID=3030834 RepID=UPI0023B8EC39|nr:F0F1 ATP synthase assembly protein I [Sphingobium arseniciresistens]
MSDNESDPDIIGEDPRLNGLKDHLETAHSAEQARARPAATGADASYSLGNRVLAELLGGVGGGALLGWLIDRFAGTAPWVAFVNIIRISNRKPDGS